MTHEDMLRQIASSRERMTQHLRAAEDELRKRDKLMSVAVKSGVPHLPVSIAGGLHRSELADTLARGQDNSYAPTQYISRRANEHTELNDRYPCCGRDARFTMADRAQEYVVRHCRYCRRTWETQRTTLLRSVAGRIDILKWSPKV